MQTQAGPSTNVVLEDSTQKLAKSKTPDTLDSDGVREPMVWNDDYNEKRAKAVLAGAAGKLFVVVDFDRTVTTGLLPDGTMTPSCHGTLEKSGILSQRYAEATDVLFKKYYAIEIDPTMSREEKIPLMYEWYHKSHGEMLKERVTQQQILDSIRAHGDRLLMRSGFADLYDLCRGADVPLIVLSAGVQDVIEEYLRERLGQDVLDHISVFSNKMIFDKDGKHVDFDSHLVHMFNKSFDSMPESIKDRVKDKTCAIVVGDSVGDLTMAHGAPDVVDQLKVGFCNFPEKHSAEAYLAAGFDGVVVGAMASFGEVVSVVREGIDERA